MSDATVSVADLKAAVKDFIQKRDWEKYHNPKDLAESICIEAAELLEVFQWNSADEVRKKITEISELERIKEELADILIYCLSLANVTDIGVAEAITNKLKKNDAKYPASKFRGRAHL
jgi:NTP pyrophosphatase (non-canonical NTP hydrolase)